MRILHIHDHSLPLQSGYVYRTLGIVDQQRALVGPGAADQRQALRAGTAARAHRRMGVSADPDADWALSPAAVASPQALRSR